MPFPKTLDELKAAGYRFDGHSNCRGCADIIEWWITPRGKRMPMDVQVDGSVKSHWVTCPKAADFRREN